MRYFSFLPPFFAILLSWCSGNRFSLFGKSLLCLRFVYNDSAKAFIEPLFPAVFCFISILCHIKKFFKYFSESLKILLLNYCKIERNLIFNLLQLKSPLLKKSSNSKLSFLLLRTNIVFLLIIIISIINININSEIISIITNTTPN